MPYSDAKLATMARRSSDLNDEIKRIKERKAKVDQAIIGEMERRGTKTLTTGGVTITYVAAENVGYNYDELAEELPKRLADKIRKREVDKQQLAILVTSGKIDSVLVAAHTSVTISAPYIKVS